MAVSLLNSLEHHCFHSPRINIQQHPNLHHCIEKDCTGVITPEMAAAVGLADEDGNVKCPLCHCDTYPKGEWKEADVHVQLCTDPTIHYPRMYKAGKLKKEDYEAWKATLTPEEQRGYYKRVPNHPVVAKINRDEAALMDTDDAAFLAIVNQRVNESAERALLHQIPHRHKTVTQKASLYK